mgnify:CR=1 FL=1
MKTYVLTVKLEVTDAGDFIPSIDLQPGEAISIETLAMLTAIANSALDQERTRLAARQGMEMLLAETSARRLAQEQNPLAGFIVPNYGAR